MAVLWQCEAALAAPDPPRPRAASRQRDTRGVYPLLFLVAEGKLMPWQEEFFGEILVSAIRAE